MSTIKVNKIENTSTSDGGVAIDSDGHVTIDGQQLPTAGPLSNRNLIINGEFQVSQRGTTFTYSGTGQTLTTYNLDRFITQAFGVYPSGDYLQITQDTDVPTVAEAGTKFAFSQKIEVFQNLTFNSSSSRGVWTKQTLEGYNCAQLNWGAAGAATITFSFWVKANKTGDFVVTLKDSTSTLSYNTIVTIASANTWQYVTKTINGPTSGGTFNTDNQAGITVALVWSIDSTWIAGTQTDQWVAANESGTTTQTQMLLNDGDIVWITGLQLEVGSKSTPFEHRSYGDELQRCQRYYQDYSQGAASFTIEGNAPTLNAYSFQGLLLPVTMRATPNAAGFVTSTTTSNVTSQGVTPLNPSYIKLYIRANAAGRFYGGFDELYFNAEL